MSRIDRPIDFCFQSIQLFKTSLFYFPLLSSLSIYSTLSIYSILLPIRFCSENKSILNSLFNLTFYLIAIANGTSRQFCMHPLVVCGYTTLEKTVCHLYPHRMTDFLMAYKFINIDEFHLLF